MILQIPYQAIGIGIAALLGLWSFITAETDQGRVAVVAVAFIVFLIPIVWPRPMGRLVGLIGWMIFGIACLISLRLRGINLR